MFANAVHAYELFERGHGAVRAYRGAQAFQALPSTKSAYETGRGLVGVIGTDKVVGAMVKFGIKLALKSRRADEDSAETMVDRMKGLVPERTGRLLNGITFEVGDDGTAEVVASAVNPSGRSGGPGEDYALFVEKGTVHTEAQPYFYEVAEAVLADRGRSLDGTITSAADEEGLR